MINKSGWLKQTTKTSVQTTALGQTTAHSNNNNKKDWHKASGGRISQPFLKRSVATVVRSCKTWPSTKIDQTLGIIIHNNNKKTTPLCTGKRWCLKLPFPCQLPSRLGWCTRWSSRAGDAANLSWRSVWCTWGKAWIWKHGSLVKAHRHRLRHRQTQVG